MLVSHFLVRVVGKKILIFSFLTTIVFIKIWKYLMCLLSFLIINSVRFKTLGVFVNQGFFNVINFRDLHCQKLRYFIDTNSHLVHVKIHQCHNQVQTHLFTLLKAKLGLEVIFVDTQPRSASLYFLKF
jgi:hypothetical protein